MSLFVFKDPPRCLIVPNKSMSNYKHPVLFAKLNKTIRGAEVIPARFWMDQGPLQNIFGSDAVELSTHDRSAAGIFFEEVSPVECRADHEVVLEDVLQRCCFLWPHCKPYRNKGGKHTQCG